VRIETVAILLGHSEKVVIAIMAALKAGFTYVPIDPAYPSVRIKFILENSNAKVLITDETYYNTALQIATSTDEAASVLKIETALAFDIDTQWYDVTVPADQPCYILFTSGSTGTPKGVVQSHRNALHFVRAYTNAIHIDASDGLLGLSNFSFDASKMSLYGALLNGATLFLHDLKGKGSEGLATLIGNGVTIYHSTPSVFRYSVDSLDRRVFRNIRMVVLGGEPVLYSDVELYKKHFPDNCLLVNGLGPTESTVTLQYFVDKKTCIDGSYAPVGYPVAHTKVSILNEDQMIAGVYEEGEMIFQSDYLAQGYWKQEAATQQAFTNDPGGTNKRCYRSGDVGRMLPNGTIEFVRRKDRQVKVRGHRVELAEIEKQLLSLLAVKEAIVVASGEESDKKLLAWATVRSSQIDEKNIRDSVKAILPDYMVPENIFIIDRMPLTVNGKVDKNALRVPSLSVVHHGQHPRTEVENTLTEIWAEILQIDKNVIGLDRNFFDLGGHSLTALTMTSRISKHFKVAIPLKEIFALCTVSNISDFIEDLIWVSGADNSSLQAIQKIVVD
jgi:amino acid adenylation domain-containing protein